MIYILGFYCLVALALFFIAIVTLAPAEWRRCGRSVRYMLKHVLWWHFSQCSLWPMFIIEEILLRRRWARERAARK